MSDAERPIRPGGMMRCCILALQEDTATPDADGKVITCPWCGEALTFRYGAWEWAPDFAALVDLERKPGRDR